MTRLARNFGTDETKKLKEQVKLQQAQIEWLKKFVEKKAGRDEKQRKQLDFMKKFAE